MEGVWLQGQQSVDTNHISSKTARANIKLTNSNCSAFSTAPLFDKYHSRSLTLLRRKTARSSDVRILDGGDLCLPKDKGDLVPETACTRQSDIVSQVRQRSDTARTYVCRKAICRQPEE
jgi:hypothetical protein